MSKLFAALFLCAAFAGDAPYAQVPAPEQPGTCADFNVMEPDEQNQAIEAALTEAPSAEQANADTPTADELVESVRAICTGGTDLTLTEAIERSTAN